MKGHLTCEEPRLYPRGTYLCDCRCFPGSQLLAILTLQRPRFVIGALITPGSLINDVRLGSRGS